MLTVDTSACIQCGLCVSACPMAVCRMGTEGPEFDADRDCLLCMHCAGACPRQAIHLNGADLKAEYAAAPTDPVERLIRTRRSIRRFQPNPPSKELIQEILDLCQWAPSGHNNRYHRWIVLLGKEKTDQLLTLCMEAIKAGKVPEFSHFTEEDEALITCGAPCILLCTSPECYGNKVIDPVIAMTTADLLLQNRGLATCWGGYLRRILGQVPAIADQLGLPEGHKVRCALMVGYADGERYPNIPFRPKAAPIWAEAE